MKTEEFKLTLDLLCNKLKQGVMGEAFDFKLVETEDKLTIWSNTLHTEVISVSKKEERQFYFVSFKTMGLDDEELVSFTNKLMDYVTTPLAERDYEKRWYIHQYDVSNGYVNLHKEQKEYVLSTKGDTDSYKTEFTRSEIGDWAKTDSNEVIDWIINKFGEEVK